jgi:hypothetical protein
LEAFSRGYNNPLYKEEEEKRRRDEADTRTLGNILSQQSIPAYARKGGVYEETPEQILQTQRLQLGQLGTPEAIKVLGNLSPLTQDPVAARNAALKQKALGALSPLLSSKYGIPPEQVNTMLQGGVTPSVLGSLIDKPKERRIIAQDGIQYYTDTGEPVIDKPVTPVGGLSPKELKEISVPGLQIMPDATPTKDDAKKIKTIKQARTQIDKLVGQYEALVTKHGWEPSPSKAGKLIRQKKAQIDLQAKNLEELGALQEADRAILGDMLGDPVNANPWNAQETALAQIQDYKGYLRDRYKTALSTRGYIDPSSLYSTAEDVRAALAAGQISKEEALKELKTNFGMK